MSSELPGITKSVFSSEGFDEGCKLCVGMLDKVGEVVMVGALLGLRDGASVGKFDGDLDVDGDSEGLTEGCEEGASEVVGI